MTFPVDKTVFYVKNYGDGTKEIQIEELVPAESKTSSTDKYTIHRFAHIIWDMKKEHFTHLDGAVLIYKNDIHAQRIKYDWKDPSGRYANRSRRMKLFRVDGKIEDQLSKDLLNAFFRYNELVEEYIAGKAK
jgi:hypothetical protein